MNKLYQSRHNVCIICTWYDTALSITDLSCCSFPAGKISIMENTEKRKYKVHLGNYIPGIGKSVMMRVKIFFELAIIHQSTLSKP